MNAYLGGFSYLLLILSSVESQRRGYLTSCDLFPGGEEWKPIRNHVIQSWIRSITPVPIRESNDFRRVGFISDINYVRAHEVTSDENLSWKAFGGMRLDGWLYGKLDNDLARLPNTTYYIFPDYLTAIHGNFENDDKLITGVYTQITHFRCKARVMELKFKSLKKGSPRITYHVPSINQLSLTPRVTDPFDEINVASEGGSVIAKRTIASHNLVAYYNGYIWKQGTPIPKEYPNSESFQRNLISVYNKEGLNFPPLENSEARKYISTLGHLVEHDSEKANLRIYSCKHPIYGHIACLVSSQNIAKGDKLYMNRNEVKMID